MNSNPANNASNATNPYFNNVPVSDTARKRSYIIDWVVVIVCTVLSGGLYNLPPSGRILFRAGPTADNQYINTNDYYAYPDRGEIIPTWGSALIAIGANFIIISIAQIWIRDWRDWHHGILGTSAALAVSTLFQVSIKILIGGFRPDFLDICKPDITKAQGAGYGGIYYDKSICTGDKAKINDALESFPSGHSNAAFAGLLFLAFYLNAKLKLWGVARGHGSLWKMLLVFAPIWGATVLSLTRLVDHQHNWYDILCGAIIGIVFAIASYRAYYASIFHPFYNHMPLLDGTLGPHGVPPPYDAKGRAQALEPVGPAMV